MPRSANQTSPGCGSVGTECLRPRCRLIFSGEERLGLEVYVEGQAVADLDLRKEHINGLGRGEAELLQNLLRALQAADWHAGSNDSGWFAHVISVPCEGFCVNEWRVASTASAHSISRGPSTG